MMKPFFAKKKHLFLLLAVVCTLTKAYATDLTIEDRKTISSPVIDVEDPTDVEDPIIKELHFEDELNMAAQEGDEVFRNAFGSEQYLQVCAPVVLTSVR